MKTLTEVISPARTPVPRLANRLRAMTVMRAGSVTAVMAAAAALWMQPLAVHAQAQASQLNQDCKVWIDRHGYSIDYVLERTGKRQPGPASAWTGNVPVGSAEPGDVLFTQLTSAGDMHVAVVEQVRRSADGSLLAARVAESNWGQMVVPKCLVTDHFGKTDTTRWVPLANVVRVWRPGLAVK